MITTLRQRNFALLWFGGLISIIGDVVLYVALPYHVYHLTGSALSTGLMFVAGTLPGVLFSGIAGVFVDRWKRKLIMVVACFLQGSCLLSLLLAGSVEWLWLIYLVAFVESTIAQFFSPAEDALLPKLVSEKHLMAANSLNALNNNAAILIGPALAGILLEVWGLTGIIIFDGASFFIAAIMIAFIAGSQAQPKGEASSSEVAGTMRNEATMRKSVWQEMLAGLHFAKSNQVIMALFISAGIANLGDAIIGVLLIPFVSLLNGGALILGWLLTLRGLGGLLGGFVSGKVDKSLSAPFIFALGLCIVGLLELVMFNLPLLYIVFVCLFLIGIPFVIFNVSFKTLLQNNVADQFRGRMFGTWGMVASLVVILGQVGGSTLADHIGIIPMLNVGGILYVISGLVAFLLMVRASSQR